MPSDVTITYTNDSENTSSDFLVFSQPPPLTVDAALSAWQLIQHIGPGGSHVFQYTILSQIRIVWDDGASTSNVVDSMPGQAWQFTMAGDDYELVANPNGNVPPDRVAVLNSVPVAVTVQIFKSGSLWTSFPGLTKGEQVDFQFEPRIAIGFGQPPVTSPTVSYAVMSDGWFEVDLAGLKSLTIAATGTANNGYEFVLRDIVEE